MDNLAAAVLALTQELSVMRDRLDTVERLIEQHGLFAQSAIEQFEPDGPTATARSERRRAYLARVFKYIQEELDRIERLPG